MTSHGVGETIRGTLFSEVWLIRLRCYSVHQRAALTLGGMFAFKLSEKDGGLDQLHSRSISLLGQPIWELKKKFPTGMRLLGHRFILKRQRCAILSLFMLLK